MPAGSPFFLYLISPFLFVLRILSGTCTSGSAMFLVGVGRLGLAGYTII